MTIGELNERITAHALIFKVETGQSPMSWMEYQVFRPVPVDRGGHGFQAYWDRIVEGMANALSPDLFLLEFGKTILEFFASTSQAALSPFLPKMETEPLLPRGNPPSMNSQSTVLWKRAIGSLDAMTTVSTVLADMTSLTDEQRALSAALQAEVRNLASALKEIRILEASSIVKT